LLPDGSWITPLLLGVIDDHSRVICHMQWYVDETAESFVHGLCQAMQKRGLPRALMSDHGAAMKSEEFVAGLHTLGIVLNRTLPYSPYMNGKKETFWSSVEGRLLAMLENVKDLTLEQLNHITQVWVEQDYHHLRHREIGTSPMSRFLEAPNVGRNCPDSAALRRAFCRTVTRKTRRSDGTVSLANRRFEIPNRYRQLERVRLRYAHWNLANVELLDPNGPTALCRLYPIDKTANAEGRRRALEPLDTQQASAAPVDATDASEPLPPLLRKILADFAATGMPSPYLPKLPSTDEPEDPS
jgi:transposase InsO family protein